MLLAVTSHDGSARCVLCTWEWKVPIHRREGRQKVLMGKEERQKLLEESLLHHLKAFHDRIMITKEEKPLEDTEIKMDEGSLFPRAQYFGRRP